MPPVKFASYILTCLPWTKFMNLSQYAVCTRWMYLWITTARLVREWQIKKKTHKKRVFKLVFSVSSIRTGKWTIFESNLNWLKTVGLKARTCRVARISFWQHQIRNYQPRVAKIGHLRSVEAIYFLTVYELCLFV